MRTYWDTSAAINAALAPQVYGRLSSGEHVARLHLLAEFFAIMTGRGVEITDEAGNTNRMVFTQSECAAWLRKFADRLKFEELTKEEALSGLHKAQRLGVQGARVYDYWHALVSERQTPTNLSRVTHATLKIWREMSFGRDDALFLSRDPLSRRC